MDLRVHFHKQFMDIYMSTAIYTVIHPIKSKDKNTFNYVYQITELSTGMKYIGSRGTNKSIALDDLKSYQSSSSNKEFKRNQRNNPLNYYYEILSYQPTRKDANHAENILHEKYNVALNSLFYNRANAIYNSFGVCNRNKTIVKDKNNKVFQCDINDPLFLSGEYISISKNTVVIYCDEINAFKRVPCDSVLNVLAKYPTSGHTTGVDKYGKTHYVKCNDTRMLSGELVGMATGFVSVRDIKTNKTMRVAVGDSRFNDGTIVGNTKGMVTVRDKSGKTFNVSKTDKDYLNGNIVSITTGRAVVKDRDNNVFQCSKDDHRYLNGDIIGVNSYWVSIDNEIKGVTYMTKKYNISHNTVIRRCKSVKYKDWIFIGL